MRRRDLKYQKFFGSFLQERTGLSEKLVKNYIFCTKAKINSKIKQPKKLFAREARKWKHLQIGKFKRKRA